VSARETLAKMALREKCAQLVFFALRFDAPDYDAAMRFVKAVGFGGVVVRGGTLLELAPLVNTLQKNSRVPLLVAADYGRGAGGEVSGATAFPSHLAVRATASEELARTKGRLTAREAKAMGVRWLLGLEAFEDDAALARAYVEGAAEQKVRAEPLADVVLAPADPEAALDALEKDVEAGRLGDAELYRRAEAVLQAKQALGLFGEKITDHAGAERIVGAPSHKAAADRIAEAAVARRPGFEVPAGPLAVVDAPAPFARELAARRPLDAAGAPVRVCFGDPRGGAWDVCAWDDAEPSQRAAARALAGEIPFAGRWRED
jgi:beta-glucosidase-like glycosyl hydrolase